MSEENVETWRGFITEMVVSDESDWESWLARLPELLDPEVEWDASEVPVPDLTGAYRGTEAVVQWWRRWLAAWETMQFHYELVDAGDRVVLLVDQRMRGRSTGIEMNIGKYAHLATFREGRIVQWKLYPSQTSALKAAGLSE